MSASKIKQSSHGLAKNPEYAGYAPYAHATCLQIAAPHAPPNNPTIVGKGSGASSTLPQAAPKLPAWAGSRPFVASDTLDPIVA